MTRSKGDSSRPKKRESRPINGRLPACHCGGDSGINNLNTLRVQRLIAVTGMSPSLAAIIAPLAFGGAA